MCPTFVLLKHDTVREGLLNFERMSLHLEAGGVCVCVFVLCVCVCVSVVVRLSLHVSVFSHVSLCVSACGSRALCATVAWPVRGRVRRHVQRMLCVPWVLSLLHPLHIQRLLCVCICVYMYVCVCILHVLRAPLVLSVLFVLFVLSVGCVRARECVCVCVFFGDALAVKS